MRFGYPGLDNLRHFSDYVLSYDKRNRTANWVMEHLTKENIRRSDDVKRGDSNFHEDPAVSLRFCEAAFFFLFAFRQRKPLEYGFVVHLFNFRFIRIFDRRTAITQSQDLIEAISLLRRIILDVKKIWTTHST